MTMIMKMPRMMKNIFLPILVLYLGMPSWAGRQEEKLSVPATRFTLRNGLQVILSEDSSLPIVSVVVAYKVGSTNELRGKSGLAHLLENLMFQGSRNVGQMQHYSYIQRIGGTLNAVTTDDKTLFYQTVPSNQLALVLWMESDRMNSLDINPAKVENIKNQLIEDIQLKKEADPYLDNSWYFDRLLFAQFSYSHPVLGTTPDIENTTAADVLDFYRTYYTPNNAVLTISGDIEEEKIIQLVQKYFSTIPMGPSPSPPDLEELPDIKNTETTIENSMASSPAFYMGYRLAPRFSDDYYSLTILEYALLRGQTSRMFQRLIEKDKTAISLSGGIETRKNQSVFKMFVRANNEITNERNQRAVLGEINKVKTTFLSEDELHRAKNMFKKDYLKRFSTNLDRALFLTEELLDRGSIAGWQEELERYLEVSHYDVSRVANKYFKENKVLVKIRTK